MSDEAVHYMESTSRLRAENEELRKNLDGYVQLLAAAEATMREVAKELRALVKLADQGRDAFAWANEAVEKIVAAAGHLDPPPVVDNPPA